MTTQYDVAAIGNAIVDVIASSDDAFLAAQGLVKGSMATRMVGAGPTMTDGGGHGALGLSRQRRDLEIFSLH